MNNYRVEAAEDNSKIKANREAICPATSLRVRIAKVTHITETNLVNKSLRKLVGLITT